MSRLLDVPPRRVQNAGIMAARTRSLQGIEVAVLLSVALLLAGCATGQRTIGGLFAAPGPVPTPSPAPGKKAASAPRTYYARIEGLKVYQDPSTSSKVVGTLSLHEKVMRYKVERGFAFVGSPKSDVKGWVDNAQLIWRLPAAPAAAAPSPGDAAPEEAPPEQVQPQEAQPEEAPPEESAAPEGGEAQAPATSEAPEADTEPLPATPQAAPPSPIPTPQPVTPSIFNPY